MMQGIINRMAENSRSCKQWCILVISAMLALAAKDTDIQSYLFRLCIVPLLMFCILDCYYLDLERKMRREMNNIVEKLSNHDDVEKLIFRVGVKSIKKEGHMHNCWVVGKVEETYQFFVAIKNSFTSPSVFLFYGALSAIILILNQN